MANSKAPHPSRSDKSPQPGAEGERSPRDAAASRGGEEPQHDEEGLLGSEELQKEPDEDLQASSGASRCGKEPQHDEEGLQGSKEQRKEHSEDLQALGEAQEEQLPPLGEEEKVLAQEEQLPPPDEGREEEKKNEVESDEEQQASAPQEKAHRPAVEGELQEGDAAQASGLSRRKEKEAEDTRAVTSSPKPLDFPPTSSARRRANSWAATVKEEAPQHRTAAPRLSAVQFQGLQDIWNLRASTQLKQTDAPSKLSRHEAEAWMMRQGVKNPDEVRKMRQVLNSSY